MPSSKYVDYLIFVNEGTINRFNSVFQREPEKRKND